MKLFVHIGTEKTGSSFLQSIAAINNDVLEKNGFFFPIPTPQKKLLLNGKISSGNAQELTNYINQDNFIKVQCFISKIINEAKKRNCSSIFLSNELLIIALSKNRKLKQFEITLKDLGISETKYLLFLRDPISHALSLYKHRAKNGKILNIDTWIKKNYYYPIALSNFFDLSVQENINLHIGKYTKKTGILEKIMFKDWMEIKDKLKMPFKVVNESLTLSELMLIKKIRRTKPFLIPKLYKKLLGIKKSKKADDLLVQKYFEFHINNELLKYNNTWDKCNKFLGANEQIILPKTLNEEFEVNDFSMSFSKYQKHVIDDFLFSYGPVKTLITQLIFILKKFIIKFLKFLKIV